MTDIRYGVFLRPDPATCSAVEQITRALKQQFGLLSAAAFAPHATLVGNLAINASPNELVAALDPVFEATSPLPVYNHGPERTLTGDFQGTYRYDIDRNAAGDQPNQALRQVAAAVKRAVMPLSVPVTDHFTVPVADYEFAGHLSLASHELALDKRLCDEVGEFIAGLPITAPSSFIARWYTLFELRAEWSGPWWENQPWRPIHSWDTASA